MNHDMSAEARRHGPYARTRVATGMPVGPLVADMMRLDVSQLRTVARQLTKVGNRVGWRLSQARRASLVASALRAGRAALGDRYAGRRRDDECWLLLGRDGVEVAPALRVVVGNAMRWADFRQPVQIGVLRADLIDVDLLACRTRKTNAGAGLRAAVGPAVS